MRRFLIESQVFTPAMSSPGPWTLRERFQTAEKRDKEFNRLLKHQDGFQYTEFRKREIGGKVDTV